MIHTSRQLKDLVRNLTKGNSLQAQIVMRNYIMERFIKSEIRLLKRVFA